MLKKNALTEILALIKDPAEQERILHAISLNVPVITLGTFPTPEQFARYLGWLKDGFFLAQDMLGKASIPAHLWFVPAPAFNRYEPGFVGYSGAGDTLCLDYVRVASDACVRNEHASVCYEMGDFSRPIPVKSHVILIVMEECFHRYQERTLHRPLPTEDTGRDHPLEVEWRKWRDEKLVQTGRVICRPTHEA